MQELLEDISKVLTGGKKLFNAIYMMNGIKIIELKDIPQDCKLLIVSKEDITEFDDIDSMLYEYQLKGLRGNIYHFENNKQSQSFECGRIKQRINQSKDKWFFQNIKKWNEETPGISNTHKIEDFILHFQQQQDSTTVNTNNNGTNREQFSRAGTTSQIMGQDYQNSTLKGFINGENYNRQSHLSNPSIIPQNYQQQINLSSQNYNSQPMNIENFFRMRNPCKGSLQISRKGQRPKTITKIQEVNNDYNYNEQLQGSMTSLPFYNNKSFITEGQISPNLEQNEANQSQFTMKHSSIPKSQLSNNQTQFSNMIENQSPKSGMQPLPLYMINKQKFHRKQLKSQISTAKITKATPRNFENDTIKKSVTTLTHKLSYQEIEMWARKYDLSWKEIYELDSEFQSLLTIEKDIRQAMLKRVQDMRFDPNKTEEDIKMELSQIPMMEQKIGDNEPGITLQIFKKYTKLFLGKSKEARRNIIQSFGIDISNKNSKIVWEQYIQLKCFLQFFTLKKSELIKLWMKILDPQGIRHVQTNKLIEFLEILVRGTVTDQQTLISKEYARNLIKLFDLEGCVSENGQEVLMEKVEQCFIKDIIDIEIVNQVLKVESIYLVRSKNHIID